MENETLLIHEIDYNTMIDIVGYRRFIANLCLLDKLKVNMNGILKFSTGYLYSLYFECLNLQCFRIFYCF